MVRCQRRRVIPCYLMLRPMLHHKPLINIHVTYVTSIFLFIEKVKKVITQHTLKTHTTSADYKISPTCENDVTYVTFNDYSVLWRNIGRNNQVTRGNSGSYPTLSAEDNSRHARSGHQEFQLDLGFGTRWGVSCSVLFIWVSRNVRIEGET